MMTRMFKRFYNLFLFFFLILQLQCSYETENFTAKYEAYITNNKAKVMGISIIKKEKDCIDFAIKGNEEAKKLDLENPVANDYFLKAIKKAQRNSNKTLEIWTKYQYASYLYQYRNMPKSLPIVIDLQKLLEEEKEIIDPGETYKFMGFYLYTIQQFEESIVFLKKSIEKIKEEEKSVLYDNIGLAYYKLKQPKLAIENYEKAKILAIKYDNQTRLAKVYGNISQLYLDNKEFIKAIGFLKKDIEISQESNAVQNTMYALIRLSNAYIRNSQIAEAENTLVEAEKIAKSKTYYKSSELEIAELQKEIAEINKNDEQELYYRKKIDRLEKELKSTDSPDTITESQYSAQIATINLQKEKEKLKVIETKFKYNILAIILVFVVVISILVFIGINRKLKIKQTAHKNLLLSSEIEKINSEKKLNDAEHSLESYRDYLNEKNSQINKLNSQILVLENGNSLQKNENMRDLQSLLASHLMTDENWYKFKKAFISTYPDYYEYLQENYDELTESNLRLIILMKLDINTKEITNLLGISADAVKKAKQRLKKKLGEKYDALLEINSKANNTKL
jgi:uncharacterized protein YeaC (DUF1315 family)